jgi:hypothetical protein
MNKYTYKILYHQDSANFVVYEYLNGNFNYKYSSLENMEAEFYESEEYKRTMNWVKSNYPPNSFEVKKWVSKNYPAPIFYTNNNVITNIKESDREEINIIKKIYLDMGLAICIIYIIFKLIFILKDEL